MSYFHTYVDTVGEPQTVLILTLNFTNLGQNWPEYRKIRIVKIVRQQYLCWY
jgi:hypothetical protein